jgi:hypothetical protein
MNIVLLNTLLLYQTDDGETKKASERYKMRHH